jgi:hypothetical protein
MSKKRITRKIHHGSDEIDDYPYITKMKGSNITEIIHEAKVYKPIIFDGHNNVEKLTPSVVATLDKFENGYVVIYDNWKDTNKINSLTDFFTEHVRVSCNFKRFISPIKYWNKNKKNIWKRISRSDIYGLREYLYANTRLCNNFRITVSLAILQMFKPKKWLDISAGWGDRLISAILYGVDLYVATDPNIDLHPYYEQIIKTLVPLKDQSNFIIYPSGFETVTLPKTKFDIVFSSPPFFDLEQYSTHQGDSLQYTTEEAWCMKFLWPSLIKSYLHLKRNGHMILYMNGSPLVMSYLRKLDTIMKYKGVIYFIDSKPRAMYVWQKTKDISVVY